MTENSVEPSAPAVAAADRGAWLPDIISGISIAGLLLPEAVAYSSIGNLPPQAGVVALFAGLICYGLLGKSRFAIVAATSSHSAPHEGKSGADSNAMSLKRA